MTKNRDHWMTKDYAHECFEYSDGELTWKERPLHHFESEHAQVSINRRLVGKRAGTLTTGYMEVKMLEGGAKNHRIIFVMHHGFMPEVVDHIDGNPLNNRIENLRAASRCENMRNVTTQARNKTGCKGVGFHKASGKFTAYIKAGGKQLYLGLFEKLEDAANARKQAEQKYHGEFANDR